MLGFAEDYLGRVRSAKNDNDIIVLLGRLAHELGYRSGYLIEYANALNDAVSVLDSSHAREGWWDRYVSSGLRQSTKSLQDILRQGEVHYLGKDRFSGPRDPLLHFMERVDMVDAAVVPISYETESAGIIALCGGKVLSRSEESALQLVCYSLFSRARSLRINGIKTASATLTPREQEVMLLSSEGLTSQEIAERLGMSARTVNQHLDNVSDKLGTRNRVHSVAQAIRLKMLQ
ncbi:RNA polymerase sigma factor, sigma-70 family [Devosia lucknowensis]|uniref:RNA polymerase sigma factor, sigma-70 family n=1 Tax=Devosia lucknowensis TaxID=1096929 RepID=A0A1Y6G7U9_9HYPH|nr:helix-turn-helix transcriptional regulator [Devosia lucknowensis]SMQ86185.1 RNA polymerase sigma factor, sigma-70 family [Devosia lucknowensis]